MKKSLFIVLLLNLLFFSFFNIELFAKDISTIENKQWANVILMKGVNQRGGPFKFDDTYLDLVKALQIPTQRGRNYASFAKGKESLQGLLGGKVEYDKNSNKWYFKRGNTVFAIGTTSEGIKKLAIFNTLLSNHYLSSNSVIFIDEIESALHPSAISSFLDIIHELSKIGIQFFIATHSYFVIKKLALLAKQENESIPVLSLSTGAEPRYDNMRFGMPDNSIIDESVRLYEAEVDFSLGGTMNG